MANTLTTLITSQTYLVQALGSDLGYRFTWEKGHVVSTKLKEDSENGENWSTDTEVSKSGALHHVKIVRQLDKKRPKSGISNVDWYQMLADITYMYKHPGDFKIEDLTAESLVNTYSKNTKASKLCVRIAVNVLLQNNIIWLKELEDD